MWNNKPKVTVLMSVYNGEQYLREAIESILNQTFRDFEFLIIDDGCTDRSVEIIQSYNDPRIRLVKNEKNLGQTASLNRGLDLASGEYIARMDADDCCPSDRLAKQVVFLESNPQIDICGTSLQTFGAVPGDFYHFPSTSAAIKCNLLFSTAVGHATVVMRRETLRKTNLYYDDLYNCAEDYDFWVRSFEKNITIHNLQEVLYYYRMHPQQKTERQLTNKKREVTEIRLRQIRALAIEPDDREIKTHLAICSFDFNASREFIGEVESWLRKLRQANLEVFIYDKEAFSKVLSKKWFDMCNSSSRLGFWVWKAFFHSSLSKSVELSLDQKLRFALRCSLRRGLN